MEILSKQLFHPLYSFLMQTDPTYWFPIKGRPDMTLEVVNTSVYNESDGAATKLFIVIKRGGVFHLIDYYATLAAVTVWRSDKTVYIAPNDEYGLGIVGNANNDVVQFAVQGIMWSDKEILSQR